MAERNLNFNRDVTNVVPEIQDTGMLDAVAEVAGNIANSSAQSKVLEATSQAQIAFKKLDQDFRIKYEGDPENPEAIKELSAARQAEIEKLGEGIPTFYTRQWADNARKLTESSTQSNGLWAVEQNYKNLVTNIENSRKNYLELASVQGQEYGQSQSNDASVLLNYNAAYQTMKEFAQENLSPSQAEKILEDFGSDYLKMTISGVAVTNPSKASKLLQDPLVVKTLGADAEQFVKFKSAIESRAKRYEHSLGQQKVVQSTRAAHAPLVQKNGRMSYAEFASADLSPAAKEYYGNLNGFTGSGVRGGMTKEDKAKYRLAVVDSVTKLTKEEEMDAGSVRVVQDAIFKAMDKGAMSQTEGMTYVNQIIEPLLAKKEATLDDFGVNKWFSDDIGFDGIKDYFDKNIKRDTSALKGTAKSQTEAANKIDQANLYDYYSAALGAQAQQMGITVAEIANIPDKGKREAIYSKAQSEAQRIYMQEKHPQLRTLPDIPNFVYNANGELVQGMAGKRNVQPVGSAKAPFKLHRHKKTGELYRVYPDGKIEKAP